MCINIIRLPRSHSGHTKRRNAGGDDSRRVIDLAPRILQQTFIGLLRLFSPGRGIQKAATDGENDPRGILSDGDFGTYPV
jgi:hypothetical protein